MIQEGYLKVFPGVVFIRLRDVQIAVLESEEKMSKFGPGSYYDYLGFCIAEDAINRNKGGGDPGGNGSGCLSILVVVAIIGGIIWKIGS